MTPSGRGRTLAARQGGGGAASATPRDAAARLESAPRLPGGDRERFSGYGVLGVGFASGHMLAMQRVVASSIGPAFTAVWHRDPSGHWTFYVDGQPELTWVRHFSPAGRVVRDDGIRIVWHGPTSFSVRVPLPGIAWAVHLMPTFGARALGALQRRLPAALRRGGVHRGMAAAAGRLLGLGDLTLSGTAPSGRPFELDAHQFWVVDASTARCRSVHLGPPVRLHRAVRLGDFTIPVWGVYTTGDAFFGPTGRNS